MLILQTDQFVTESEQILALLIIVKVYKLL